MPTLKELIAQRASTQGKPRSEAPGAASDKKPSSFASLAEIIKRQQNAKESAGDRELAAEKQGHLQIAKQLVNASPEIIVSKAEQEQDRKERAGTLVAAPVISLKGLIAASQKQAEEQITKAVVPTHGPKFDLEGNRIFEFDESQDAAVKGMLANQFACLIGAAGTGKSKTVNDFIVRLESEIGTIRYKDKDATGREITKYKPSIWIGAFTGRAVEMVKTKIDPKYHGVCGTIHGETCLAYQPEYYEEVDEKTGMFKTKMRFVPSFNEYNKLPYNIYIVDEAGMLSVDLWNTMRKAMLPNARVYFVGDINQLPPVYGRSILGFAMSKWPTFELTKIHRQAANNPIIANAHRILRGEPPVEVRSKFDFQKLDNSVGSLGAQQRALAIVKHLHKQGSFNEYKDGFIVPQNVGPLGKDQFNELLTPYFNPDDGKENKRYLIKTGIAMVAYARRDKIMLLANDKEKNLTNGQIGVITNIAFNGAYQNMKASVTHSDLSKMHSTVVGEDEVDEFTLDMEDLPAGPDEKKEKEEQNLRQASHIVTARFGEFDWADLEEYHRAQMLITANYIDSKMFQQFAENYFKDKSGLDMTDANAIQIRVREHARLLHDKLNRTSREVSFSTAGEYRLITHAYCFTCHKSQGGEYPTVVILIHSANARLLSREWLYTAVTRAQNRIVLIFNDRGIMQALRLQRIKGKTLKEKINSFIEFSKESSNFGADEGKVPNLPERKEM